MIDKKLFDKISWKMPGLDIEKESFDRIDKEAGSRKANWSDSEWKVIRRLIHTTANFKIIDHIKFSNNPIEAGLNAINSGKVIYSDSNMIKSGLSVFKLQQFNEIYTRESIRCYIADSKVAQIAKEKKVSRALTAVEYAKELIDDAIVLIGNAPLALAGIIRLAEEENIRPALIIGMPVGFVNVIESKELLYQSDIPYISIEGRMGGSPLAVATLHALMEPYL